jgi:hypothetical protein
MLRRVTALVSSLLMLQLSFAASDLVCARHDGGTATGNHHPDAHDAAESHATHQSHHAVGAPKSCEVPARSDCCAALASCGPSIGMLASTREPDARSITVRVDARIAAAPLSLTPAPEPPPPKA